MFVGHFAVALAAKKPAPTVSLGTLFVAAQFLDLLWPLLLLSGMESVGLLSSDSPFLRLELHDYPISHSLLTVVGWSLLFGVAYFLLRRSARGAWIVGLAVFSHWVLDFITHRPDIPLYPGSTTYIGLGLWNSFAGTMIVEGVLFLAAVALYARATAARDATGMYAFWTLVGLLVIMYLANAFGPPPPDARAIAWAALGQWLFVPWMYWIDRHRTVRAAT